MHAPVLQDLHRTLPNEALFQSEEGRRSLERVLGAYSVFDPDVIGYCQSMNVLCGGLLLWLKDEEEVFWTLVSVIHQRVGYYTKTMYAFLVLIGP